MNTRMKRLILVGAGHAHAQVLKHLAAKRTTDLEIVLLTPDMQAPYSGMIPGWLAGHYQWQECCIDFHHLCRQSGARIHLASVTTIDPGRNTLTLDDGASMSYDWLSLNIGSTLRPHSRGQLAILPMRPLSALRQRWEQLQQTVHNLAPGTHYRIVMVGGGVAGVECILAAQQRLTRLAPHIQCEFSLVTRGPDIMSGMAHRVARRLRRHLAAHDVNIIHNFPADHTDDKHLISADGRRLAADAVLWATGAEAHAWPRQSTLKTDQHGFICIDPMLRSVSHPNVFAVGDCAAWRPRLPKAGVFAVRMGPVLAANISAAIHAAPLTVYHPQTRYLIIAGTATRHAVACWGAFSWEGAWVWRWKERIDRNFLARYNNT